MEFGELDEADGAGVGRDLAGRGVPGSAVTPSADEGVVRKSLSRSPVAQGTGCSNRETLDGKGLLDQVLPFGGVKILCEPKKVKMVYVRCC